MFQSWRLKLREVEESLRVGRLDEAHELLRQGGLLEYLPAKRLAEQLAVHLAERARRRAENRDIPGGWRDLETALGLCDVPANDVAKRCLLDASISDTEKLLCGGELTGAMAQLDLLERHAGTHPRLQTLRQVVRCLQSARNLGRRGKFSDAEAQLDMASALRPDLTEIQQLRQDCHSRLERTRQMSEQLFRALSDKRWEEALKVADELLEIAPDMKLARDARQRAWQHVGARVDSYCQVSTHVLGSSSESGRLSVDPESSSRQPRFLLWVDGVGGYLVCLGDAVLLGQAMPGNMVDVPILGDLSRKHAGIRRSGEGYVIDPYHATRLNTRIITNSAPLSDGDEIELGKGVKYVFRKPHVLSASARLDPVSRHRMQPSADGVLLMAESCVLGPNWQNHVVCRDWSSDVVLYRHDGELSCRSVAPIEVDGQVFDGRAVVRGNARVLGKDFSMCVEELDRCSSQPLL